jgi:hypothetical protein
MGRWGDGRMSKKSSFPLSPFPFPLPPSASLRLCGLFIRVHLCSSVFFFISLADTEKRKVPEERFPKPYADES